MLTAIGVTSAAFGVSVVSALMPVISIELFVMGLVLKGPALPWWLLAVVVTAGQIGGKVLHYYAARGAIRLPRFLHLKSAREGNGRWRGWLQHFRDRCHDRPAWTNGVLFFSATTSLPPYAATAVVAGWARIPLHTFVITGLTGRFLRFTALILAPGVVAAWL